MFKLLICDDIIPKITVSAEEIKEQNICYINRFGSLGQVISLNSSNRKKKDLIKISA
jgi:hypothetical protein